MTRTGAPVVGSCSGAVRGAGPARVRPARIPADLLELEGAAGGAFTLPPSVSPFGPRRSGPRHRMAHRGTHSAWGTSRFLKACQCLPRSPGTPMDGGTGSIRPGPCLGAAEVPRHRAGPPDCVPEAAAHRVSWGAEYQRSKSLRELAEQAGRTPDCGAAGSRQGERAPPGRGAQPVNST
jgi:hypothetical protein